MQADPTADTGTRGNPAEKLEPRRIYLDQNAWIRLARQVEGKTHDAQLERVLTFIRRESAERTSIFPLSAAHYFETLKRGNSASRQRLGAFMFSIAGLDRIADASILLPAELHAALSRNLGLPEASSPSVFGRGFTHVFKEAADPYSSPAFQAAMSQLGRAVVEDLLEAALLGGPPFQLPGAGIARPDDTYAMRQLENNLLTQRRLVEAHASSDFAKRVVLAQEIVELIDPLNEFLMVHNASIEPYRDRERLTALLLSLPSKAAIARMRWSAHQNFEFRWDKGDLNDLVALGTAAAYCDIVVCEKHWGSILKRHQRDLKARVVTSLDSLLEVFAGG